MLRSSVKLDKGQKQLLLGSVNLNKGLKHLRRSSVKLDRGDVSICVHCFAQMQAPGLPPRQTAAAPEAAAAVRSRGDESVSRVLYAAPKGRASTIYLGQSSRKGSINLPAGAGRAARCALAGRVSAYLVFQPLRFTQPDGSPRRWCALTAPFHPYRRGRHVSSPA